MRSPIYKKRSDRGGRFVWQIYSREPRNEAPRLCRCNLTGQLTGIFTDSCCLERCELKRKIVVLVFECSREVFEVVSSLASGSSSSFTGRRSCSGSRAITITARTATVV